MARGEGERLEVIAALAKPESRLAVLLGNPGSGKTTLVNYLTHRLAEAELKQQSAGQGEALAQKIPPRVVLRDCGEEPQRIWAGLRRDMCRHLGDTDGAYLFDAMREKLRHHGLFLLDGLDEVPVAGERRKKLLEAVSALAAELTGELENRADLGDLASRPLLLTLIASLHTNRAKMPEDRADLYEESVHLLMHRWQRRLDEKDNHGIPVLEPELARVLRLGDQPLRAGLEALAYQTHCRLHRVSSGVIPWRFLTTDCWFLKYGFSESCCAAQVS